MLVFAAACVLVGAALALLARYQHRQALATWAERQSSMADDRVRLVTLWLQDVQAARREAHTLKGAAATISAPALRSLALEAEQAAAAGEWSRIEEVLPRMESQLEPLKNAIAEWQ